MNSAPRQQTIGATGVPNILRWIIGGIGLGLLVYFGGGTIATVRTRGLELPDTIMVVGALVGASGLALGLLGGHAVATRVARGALTGGLIGTALAIFPGAILLGQILGSQQASGFFAATALVPLALLVGAITGGLHAISRPR